MVRGWPPRLPRRAARRNLRCSSDAGEPHVHFANGLALIRALWAGVSVALAPLLGPPGAIKFVGSLVTCVVTPLQQTQTFINTCPSSWAIVVSLPRSRPLRRR